MFAMCTITFCTFLPFQARVPIRYGVVALPGGSDKEVSFLAAGTAPLPLLPPETPASGLYIALLHAEAITYMGLDCGSGFLAALGTAYQTRAAAAHEYDGSGAGGDSEGSLSRQYLVYNL